MRSAEPMPDCQSVGTVHHGIDLGEFTFDSPPGAYLAVLKQVAPEKGMDTGHPGCQAMGIPLKIAAREPLALDGDPNVRRDREYYEQVLKPLLRGPG